MKLFKAIATIGSLTLFSRIIGFVRDIMTAAILGAGPVADAFFVALKLPNFFRRITAEGAFSVSFIPMFSEKLEKEGKESALKFASEAQAVMIFVMSVFSAVVMIVMPWVIHIIAPGFVGESVRYDLAVDLSRITFPYILMISLAALMGGVLNSFDKFAPFAAAPIFFNICLISAMYFLTPFVETAGHSMAWGVAIAGVVQFLFLLYFLFKYNIRIKIKKPSLSFEIKNLFKLMGPGIIGAGVVQINLFVDMILASTLPIGAISYLYYADRLYQLPFGVIAIAIGTALLPVLTRKLASGKNEEANEIMGQSLEMGLMLALPAAVALFVIPMPIMQVLFERGAFNGGASWASAQALMAYSVGLPAFVMVKIFSTAYFAEKDTKTPVKCAIIGTLSNIVLSCILIFSFKHVGIAMATSMAAWLNLSLLLLGLRKKKAFKITDNSRNRIWLIVLISITMGIVLYIMKQYLFDLGIADLPQQWSKVIWLTIMVVTGGLYYLSALVLSGVLSRKRIKRLLNHG